MGLQKHIIKSDDIRLQIDDLIIKQVTHERKENIKKFMIEKYTTNEDGYLVSEATFSGIEFYRYLITELTNWSSEVKDISDEELEELLLNGDSVIKSMLEEFNKICNEIASEQKSAFFNMMGQLESFGESIDTQVKLNENLNLISEKLGVSKEQVLEMMINGKQLNELQKILKEENNKNKLQSIPRDYKKAQPKKPRKNKKVAEAPVEELEKQVAEDESKLKDLKSQVNQDGE